MTPPAEPAAGLLPRPSTIEVDTLQELASPPRPLSEQPAGLTSAPTPMSAPQAPITAAPAVTAHGDGKSETPATAEPRRRRDGDTTWSRLASDVVAAAELAEELEVDLEATRRELMDARKAQRRAEQERDEAVEARFTAKTVLEALKVAEACFPDRLMVLASARASAETSPYRNPERDLGR